jgi:hypothetical protein
VAVLRLVNVVSVGLVSGAVAMELVLVLPTLRTVSDGALLEVHHGMLPRASRYIPVLGAVGSITGAVVVFQHDISDGATILTLAGLASFVAAVLMTYRLYLPVAAGVSSWTAGAVPQATREATMSRWFRLHATRTVFFVGSFVLFAAAAIAA